MSLEGTQLGHYRLLRPIGSGGMGEVYLAEDTRIHRQVAIKVIREEAAPYPDANATKEAARLFQREMRAISQLDHPHILPLFDFDEETVNRTKLTYMVMPFRQEGSLADWLQERSSAQMLSPQDVAHFVYQAADALQHAHDHHLIHQDVKPSNFLIRSRSSDPSHPDLLLADFGIAKFTTATATASQSIRGTPAYMAPEQWDGQPVAETDQYALAVMAYQLLTGRPPFLGGPGQVMRQHFQAQPPPPSMFNPRIPPALDTVILRALEKQSEARFASIAEFARVFQQAAQGASAASAPSTQPPALVKERPRPSTRGSDIHATLAISQAEALTGTSRTLTLPGGRQVTVSVPADAHDGQVVRLDGQGEASPTGGEAGALILTILVAAAQEPPSLSAASAAAAEETLLTANQTVPATGAPTASDTSQQPTVRSTAHSELGTPTRTEASPTEAATPASQESLPPTRMALPATPSTPARPGTLSLTPASGGTRAARSSGSKKTPLLVIGLLLLLVLASGLGLFYLTHPSSGTGTSGTSSSDLTATAAANATATAQSNATATASVVAGNANPYPPHIGVLVLNDPLSNNSRGYGWLESAQCYFSGGAYHLVEPQVAYFAWCTARPVFSNLVYEVQMTVLQGDCGALTFRVSSAGYYFFSICQDGYYSFDVNDFSNGRGIHDLRTGHSSAIHLGLNQMNVFAVVANGSNFDMYVNGQHIDSASDSTFSQGQIALAANTLHGSTEIAYQNARVWTL